MKKSISKLCVFIEKITDSLEEELLSSWPEIVLKAKENTLDTLDKLASLTIKLSKVHEPEDEGLGMTHEEEQKILQEFLERYR